MNDSIQEREASTQNHSLAPGHTAEGDQAESIAGMITRSIIALIFVFIMAMVTFSFV